MGYVYDRFELGPTNPIKTCPVPVAAGPAAAVTPVTPPPTPQPVTLASADLALMRAPLAAPIGAAAGMPGGLPGSATLLTSQISELAKQNKELFLVLENMRSNAGSETIYRVFLEPTGGAAGGGVSQYVGLVQFLR